MCAILIRRGQTTWGWAFVLTTLSALPLLAALRSK